MIANELRLGNYCEYYIEDMMEKHDPGFWVRNKIDLQDIECCLNNKEHFDKHYRPTPLTEEILEKCGFVEGEWLDETSLRYLYQANDILYISDSYSCPCKYLHQLQNLIFALTGTELEIKL